MDTPKRMSLADSLAQISEYFTLQCHQEGPSNLTCAHCGTEIRRVRAYMSLHDSQYGDLCIGPARAWRMEIPYCEACEDEPSRYGCIHLSETEMNLPIVIKASRPFGKDHPEYQKQTRP